MLRRWLVTCAVLCAALSCKKTDDKPVERAAPPTPAAAQPTPPPSPPPVPAAAPTQTTEPSRPPLAEKPSTAPGPTTPEVADAPAGNPPPDGKYERVVVEGVTVPMVSITHGGTIVLVDTDGKKPRTWEEQYKKKAAKLPGQLDIHKTNTNKNDTFEDDAIDREGIWTIDAKGNITRH